MHAHLGGQEDGKEDFHKANTSPPKLTNGEEPKFISICNREEFLVESKETKHRFTLVVKEEVSPVIEVRRKWSRC